MTFQDTRITEFEDVKWASMVSLSNAVPRGPQDPAGKSKKHCESERADRGHLPNVFWASGHGEG